ncbi:DUF2567 domain-containing protein [Streptomyces solicathayae]|uniref:DUF2567 domain-containing protein n=1 Tax=Streptomyces solicathayae TaxID=3081768 RepID=A0ABZ0LZG5_9ACTN|nr:DUF2567 domain-containing protein [Streptomyces sp. HUAS YS2]WOX24910.1 DUF2567 domain-containing protein [Streptomyces sp. HUAS YS2]
MTAPLTPPHQPHSQPHGDTPWPEPFPKPAPDVPGARHEVRDALGVVALSALAGVVFGLLWLWLAPRIPLISDGKAVFLKNSEGEAAIGADGTFALLGLGFGALAGLLVFLWRRHGGVGLVLGLAAGGLAGSAVAWGVGSFLGPTDDVVAHARAVGKGVAFDAPLELNTVGALLAWPIAAMILHLALTTLFGPRDAEPEWGPWEQVPPRRTEP